MNRIPLLVLMVFGVFGLSAQSHFYGIVKKWDGSATPIYQALVKVKEGEKVLPSIKSYFDGSYKFELSENKTYKVYISKQGCSDTTFTITTDKDAKPSMQYVTVRLIKDGMRLTGSVRSRDEKFPIRDATVILRNVMTREEQRSTTGIDGSYNLRLDYETNYRLSLDKWSPGIMNKYRDTTFYLSTVGFSQPVDYRLDVYLIPDEEGTTEPREDYDPTRTPENKKLKPALDLSKIKYRSLDKEDPGQPAKKPTTTPVAKPK
ncbi:MAG: carboxypeptidase regulatory-like domain-containing protein [Bacteroidetes bacterium]|nr:carboxypeptidase regulatory-like domain-containing protein [Bacteroidota bacterium]